MAHTESKIHSATLVVLKQDRNIRIGSIKHVCFKRGDTETKSMVRFSQITFHGSFRYEQSHITVLIPKDKYHFQLDQNGPNPPPYPNPPAYGPGP